MSDDSKTGDDDRIDPMAELVKWRRWAVRLLGIGYLGDDEDLRNQINAAPETCADATTDIARERLNTALSRYLSVPPGSTLEQLARLAALVLEAQCVQSAGVQWVDDRAPDRYAQAAAAGLHGHTASVPPDAPRLPIGPWMADVVAVLRSPEGRAAIAECMHRPPVRQPDGTWREPRLGAEAKPGDMVRYLDGSYCGEVYEVEPDGVLRIRDQLMRFTADPSEVEVVTP